MQATLIAIFSTLPLAHLHRREPVGVALASPVAEAHAPPLVGVEVPVGDGCPAGPGVHLQEAIAREGVGSCRWNENEKKKLKNEKCLFLNTQEFLHNIFITSFK